MEIKFCPVPLLNILKINAIKYLKSISSSSLNTSPSLTLKLFDGQLCNLGFPHNYGCSTGLSAEKGNYPINILKVRHQQSRYTC